MSCRDGHKAVEVQLETARRREPWRHDEMPDDAAPRSAYAGALASRATRPITAGRIWRLRLGTGVPIVDWDGKVKISWGLTYGIIEHASCRVAAPQWISPAGSYAVHRRLTRQWHCTAQH